MLTLLHIRQLEEERSVTDIINAAVFAYLRNVVPTSGFSLVSGDHFCHALPPQIDSASFRRLDALHEPGSFPMQKFLRGYRLWRSICACNVAKQWTRPF